MLRPADQIGRYHLQRRLATGGMGTLYLAHDPVLDRTVALKLFHGDLERPDARDGFVREARAVAALNHPNIVTIYDYGEYGTQPFLVMEYIQGETLADFIRRRPTVPDLVTVKWVEDLCAAVGYAHQRGIIHRDLKPANLIVDAYGRLKVLDFGIARMRGTLASQSTAVIGTPGYVAPEQIRGGTIDHRSDLFSIGVVCYELLTFVEPFAAETTHAITHRTLNDAPVPLDQARADVDAELAAIVMRALAKDAGARWQTAEEMRDALAGVRRHLDAAEPETIVAQYVPPGADPDAATMAGTVIAAAGEEPPARTTTPGEWRPHRRTTRESLARQRQSQVQGWVDLAREHLAAGEHAEARDACQQALALDPAHAEALAISAALDPPANATVLRTVDAAAASVSERVSRPSAPEPAFVPESPPPVHAPPADAPPEPAPAARVVASSRAPMRPGRSGTRAPVRAVAALGVLALAGVAAAVYLMQPAPAPVPVSVVIDAAPWATVASVETEGGERQPLPAERSTPLVLALVPGTYRVSLVGPPSASEPRQISIRVEDGHPSQVFLERFVPMTVDEYFRSAAAVTVADASEPPLEERAP